MYKLPQLPHDQFAAFVCALFNQSISSVKERDFEIEEEWIHSSIYNVTIFTISLLIERPIGETFEELKERTEELLTQKNLAKRNLIIATNYVLDVPMQAYLDKQESDYNVIYLDWMSISVLANNPILRLDFSEFYPNLNFQRLPLGFENGKEEIAQYRKVVDLTSRIFKPNSSLANIFRILLANLYKKNGLTLEALQEYKINAQILQNTIVENPNQQSINVYYQTYTRTASLYYELGMYLEGIYWLGQIFNIIRDIYEPINDSILIVIESLIRGYINIGAWDSAQSEFLSIENSLIERAEEISLERRIGLYLAGVRIYEIKEVEEKALLYFEKIWNLLEDEQNQKIIGKNTNLTQQTLKKRYSQYYEKLKNQKHLINTTFSHNLPTDNTQLPFALKQVHIKGFQSIKDLKINAIPVNAQWIFITGKNGSGKSSILKAITAGIVGDVIQEHIRPSTEKDCIISIELLQDNTNQIQTLKSEDRRWQLYTDKELDVRNIPLLAYGVSRLNIQTEGSEDRRYKDDHVFSLLKSDEGNLSNVEEWLKDEMLKILKDNGNKLQYEMVKKVLSELMPSVSRVDYNDKEAHIEYTENGEVVKMERLASGNKSILAMVGDILIRLLRFYPNTEKTEDFKGIIIIDELDLHLHPSWQRELPWLLSTLFPKVQFICSTHSIIPFMGAPKNSVFFTVDRTEEEGTTIQQLDIDVSNLSANILLSSPLFDVPLLSKVAEAKAGEEDKSQEYRTESNYEEYNENVKSSAAFKRLQEKYGDIFGEQKPQK